MAQPDFWSGTYGVIVGSIVGGLIALAGQWVTIRDVRRTRAEDRRMEQQALGHSILFQVMRIHSNFVQIDNHWKECAKIASANVSPPEIWQYLLPLANLPEKIKLENRELVFFAYAQ